MSTDRKEDYGVTAALAYLWDDDGQLSFEIIRPDDTDSPIARKAISQYLANAQKQAASLKASTPRYTPPDIFRGRDDWDDPRKQTVHLVCNKCKGTYFGNAGEIDLNLEDQGAVIKTAPNIWVITGEDGRPSLAPMVVLADAEQAVMVDEWRAEIKENLPTTRGGHSTSDVKLYDGSPVLSVASWDWGVIREAKQNGRLHGYYKHVCLGCGFTFNMKADRFASLVELVASNEIHEVSLQGLRNAWNKTKRKFRPVLYS